MLNFSNIILFSLLGVYLMAGCTSNKRHFVKYKQNRDVVTQPELKQIRHDSYKALYESDDMNKRGKVKNIDDEAV